MDAIVECEYTIFFAFMVSEDRFLATCTGTKAIFALFLRDLVKG